MPRSTGCIGINGSTDNKKKDIPKTIGKSDSVEGIIGIHLYSQKLPF
jgi:hypothetical protein